MSDKDIIILSNDDENTVEIIGEVVSNIFIETEIIGTGPRGEKGDMVSFDSLSDEDFDKLINRIRLPAEYVISDEDRQFITQQEKDNVLKGYIHKQIVASDSWKIEHPLNKYPSVTIVDTGGNIVYCDIKYESLDMVIISATAPFSGNAYLI